MKELPTHAEVQATANRRSAFGRLARGRVNKFQTELAKETDYRVSRYSIEVKELQTERDALIEEMKSLESLASHEGTNSVVRESLQDLLHSAKENLLKVTEDLKGKEADAETSLAAQKFVKIPRESLPYQMSEHESTLSVLKKEVSETLRVEQLFEAGLDVFSADNRDRWTNTRFDEFLPFIEEQYLEKGVVANLVLRTFLENSALLPENLRNQAEEQINLFIKEYVEEEVRLGTAGFNGVSPSVGQKIANSITQKLQNTFKDPSTRQEKLLELLGKSDGLNRMKFTGPEAAKIAVREIVLRRGTADVKKLRFALATFLPSEYRGIPGHYQASNYPTPEERAILVHCMGVRPSERVISDRENEVLTKYDIVHDRTLEPAFAALAVIDDAEFYAREISRAEELLNEAKERDWAELAKAKAGEAAVSDANEAKAILNTLRDSLNAFYASSEASFERANGIGASVNSLLENKERAFPFEDWNKVITDIYEVRGSVNLNRNSMVDGSLLTYKQISNPTRHESLQVVARRACEDELRSQLDMLRAAEATRPNKIPDKFSSVASEYSAKRRENNLTENIKSQNTKVRQGCDEKTSRIVQLSLEKRDALIQEELRVVGGIERKASDFFDKANSRIAESIVPEMRKYFHGLLASLRNEIDQLDATLQEAAAKQAEAQSAVEVEKNSIRTAIANFTRETFGGERKPSEHEVALQDILQKRLALEKSIREKTALREGVSIVNGRLDGF